MSSLSYSQQWPLWLLLALPLLWLTLLRRRAVMSRARLVASLVLRSFTLVMLVAALMAPMLNLVSRDLSVVYALDISDSIDPAFIQRALDWMRAANAHGKPAQARYLAFGDRPRLVDSVDAIGKLAVSRTAISGAEAIAQDASNLETALDAALTGFAPHHGKRLVLISDGNQTEGNVWRALPRLQAQRVRVFGVPAQVAVTRDAWIVSIDPPAQVRQLEPLTVAVSVWAYGVADASVELKLGGETLAVKQVLLAPGRNEFQFEARFKQRGHNVLSARVLAAGDQVTENDSVRHSVWVQAKPKVLYAAYPAESAQYLASALRRQGIEVTVCDAAALASGRAAIESHDAVILSDIPAPTISAASAKRLEAFVRAGGGLVFVAGENAHGKDGYADNAIGKLLPVKFEGKRRRKELDLVLLIDRSHSMRGPTLEYAKTAALAILDLLDQQHRLAVIGFDSQPQEAVAFGEVGDKARARESISRITASGKTNIFKALFRAFQLLEKSTAKTKHVILLSDGHTALPPGDRVKSDVMDSEASWELVLKSRGLPSEWPALIDGVKVPQRFAELAANLAAAKISVSTVAIGERPNLELMSNLASWTNGASHVAASDAEIPSLFVEEAKHLLAESMVEESFRPIVKTRAEAISGVDFRSGPQLKGYIVSRAGRFAEVLLEAKDGKPLLVQARHGLGKTVAFLSDVKNRWAADWLNWDGYGKLWAQVVRSAVRDPIGAPFKFDVGRSGREAVVTLTVLDAHAAYLNGLTPRVRVRAPDASAAEIALHQSGPGAYTARTPLSAAANALYEFELLDVPQPNARAGAVVRSLYYARSDEYRWAPPNQELLRSLSAQTGGVFAPRPRELFADYGDGVPVVKALWRYFAATALLLFLLELLVRRLPARSKAS